MLGNVNAAVRGDGSRAEGRPDEPDQWNNRGELCGRARTFILYRGHVGKPELGAGSLH